MIFEKHYEMADCVAPGCDYARTFKGKRSVFQFPTDPVRLRAWLKSIPRKNFAPTKHSKICEVHFEERFISRTTSAIRPDGTKAEARLTGPKLTADAIPTLFPNAFLVANKNETLCAVSKYASSPTVTKRKSPNLP